MRYQTKFINKVKTIADEAGLDFIHNRQWANTGRVQIQDDDFNVLVDFSYGFQDGYYGINPSSASKENGVRSGFMIKYDQPEETRAILASIKEAVSRREG
jgi:hypothetical protein